MKPELVEAIKSQISEFPCCKNIDPKNMDKSQDLVHSLVTHLYCGGRYFDLAVAIKTWKPDDFRVFVSLISGLKAQLEEGKKPRLVKS